MRTNGLVLAAAVGAIVGTCSTLAFGLESTGVLVLYNAASADSQEIAQYYAQVHPGVRLLGLQGVGTDEEVTEDVYLNSIRPQVLAALDDSVDCIVTTKGLPLRIRNTNPGSHPITNVYSSLESELTRIDTISTADQMGNQMPPMPSLPPSLTNPAVVNPYCGQSEPFDYETYGTRLAARLDGFTADDVKTSIARACGFTVYSDKHFIVDDDPDITYDRMAELADNVLAPRGLNYQYDNTDAFIRDAAGPVIGYVSHGRHGGAPAGYILDEENGLRFEMAAGAVFHTWESFNAYSFTEGGNRYGQGLVAEWIARGGAAGVGTVEEPGAATSNVTNEERLFQMLLDGFTFAEAAWSSTMQLSYVNTVVGDPLMGWYEQLLPADANCDGIVDAGDLDIVLANWGSFTYAGNRRLGDISGDGFVGQLDIDSVLWYWGQTCPPMGGDGGAAPEPTALGIMGLGACLVVLRRRYGP